MRWCVSVGAVLVAGAIVGGDVAGIAAPSPKSRFAETKHNVPSVNVELVIAVDVSYSMDMDELAIQREGYAQAIVSKDFLQALRAGPGSKVAVTYFEWSMSGDEKIIIPWRVIDGPESADAVAAEIMKTPVRRGSSTSISGAINFAVQLFEENPYRGLRRVIDISGDGPNNDGAPVTGARDAALAKGIIINGLPIMVKEPSYSTIDIENLEGAILFDDRYRESRSLLRGLRDRRAGRLHHDDQRSRKIPGSDPDQACSRSCRPHAGAPDRPSRRERAPGALSDRRKKMAGAQGAVSVETIIQSRRTNKFVDRSYHDRSQRARAGIGGANVRGPKRRLGDVCYSAAVRG